MVDKYFENLLFNYLLLSSSLGVMIGVDRSCIVTGAAEGFENST